MTYIPNTRAVNHVRYYFTQIERLEKALNDEQMGRLFFAVARYARTGKKEEVSPELIFPYSEMCYAFDKSRMGLGGNVD